MNPNPDRGEGRSPKKYLRGLKRKSQELLGGQKTDKKGQSSSPQPRTNPTTIAEQKKASPQGANLWKTSNPPTAGATTAPPTTSAANTEADVPSIVSSNAKSWGDEVSSRNRDAMQSQEDREKLQANLRMYRNTMAAIEALRKDMGTHMSMKAFEPCNELLNDLKRVISDTEEVKMFDAAGASTEKSSSENNLSILAANDVVKTGADASNVWEKAKQKNQDWNPEW